MSSISAWTCTRKQLRLRFGMGPGKLVMESIVETKASTLLDFLHGLRGELHVDVGRRDVGGLAVRRAQTPRSGRSWSAIRAATPY